MVTVKKQGKDFIFEVKGMHKLWAFKNQLIIPEKHILKVYQDLESIKEWKGIKSPGINIPTIITAGTFLKNGDMIFWDVSNIQNSIIIELEDEEYKKLVIEVENPKDSMAILTS
jgi:hypothetical protein